MTTMTTAAIETMTAAIASLEATEDARWRTPFGVQPADTVRVAASEARASLAGLTDVLSALTDVAAAAAAGEAVGDARTIIARMAAAIDAAAEAAKIHSAPDEW